MISLWVFIKWLKVWWFQNKPPFSFIFKPIIGGETFRDDRNVNTLIIPLFYTKKAILNTVGRDNFDKNKCSVKQVLFDGNKEHANESLAYVNKLGKFKKQPAIISRDNLKLNSSEKFVLFILITALGTGIFTLVYNTSTRRNLSVFLLEFAEVTALIYMLKKLKCQKVLHFNCFEKDSNFISFLLDQKGIRSIKFPSPNPLKRFYKYNYADIFALTAPYHSSEVNQLKDNWRIKNTIELPPFRFQYFIQYRNSKNTNGSYKLGYLSSAMWLREQLNLSGLKEEVVKSEEKLQQLLAKNWTNELLVLLHPLEKKQENYETALNYYKNLFNDRVAFPEKSMNSYQVFDQFQLGIASHSSSIMERLFLGYKSLFAPFFWTDSIFANDPSLRNISVFNEQELTEHLDKDISISDEKFFDLYGIQSFHYKNFDL